MDRTDEWTPRSSHNKISKISITTMSSIQQSPILTVGSVFILSFRFSVFCFYFVIMSFGSFLREEIALLLLFCFLFFHLFCWFVQTDILLSLKDGAKWLHFILIKIDNGKCNKKTTTIIMMTIVRQKVSKTTAVFVDHQHQIVCTLFPSAEKCLLFFLAR